MGLYLFSFLGMGLVALRFSTEVDEPFGDNFPLQKLCTTSFPLVNFSFVVHSFFRYRCVLFWAFRQMLEGVDKSLSYSLAFPRKLDVFHGPAMPVGGFFAVFS